MINATAIHGQVELGDSLVTVSPWLLSGHGRIDQKGGPGKHGPRNLVTQPCWAAKRAPASGYIRWRFAPIALALWTVSVASDEFRRATPYKFAAKSWKRIGSKCETIRINPLYAWTLKMNWV